MRRPPAHLLALAVVATVATSCGTARDESRAGDTMPRITGLTAPPATSAPVTTPAPAPVAVLSTAVPTVPRSTNPPSTARVTSPQVTSPPISSPSLTAPVVTAPPAVAPQATPATSAAPVNVLRPGATGDAVRALQTALIAQGYQIALDGRYGANTEAAVRDWQARNGLEADGLAGPRTRASLELAPGAGAPPPVTPTVPVAPPPTTSAPAAPTTVAVTPGRLPECTAEVVAADTGRTVSDVECHAGWAAARPIGCDPEAGCNRVNVFHNTSIGWVFDGVHRDNCAENLLGSGMSPGVALQFAEYCNGTPPDATNILPGSAGPGVVVLQIALVGQGYPIDVDRTYGPRTEAAVRDWQSRHGLEVDGIAGPDTQRSLGI